jgi:hypothetical protein
VRVGRREGEPGVRAGAAIDARAGSPGRVSVSDVLLATGVRGASATPSSNGTTATRPRRSSSRATGNQLVGPTSGLWTRTNAGSRDVEATGAACRRARAARHVLARRNASGPLSHRSRCDRCPSRSCIGEKAAAPPALRGPCIALAGGGDGSGWTDRRLRLFGTLYEGLRPKQLAPPGPIGSARQGRRKARHAAPCPAVW